jgi:Leucine-rich repeat (LRR) protein
MAKIVSLELFNAINDTKIADLTNGTVRIADKDIVSRMKEDGAIFSIRAIVSGASSSSGRNKKNRIQSVRFVHSQMRATTTVTTHSHSESKSPFLLCGNRGTDALACPSLSNDEGILHTVTATPYVWTTRLGGRLRKGRSLTVSFNIEPLVVIIDRFPTRSPSGSAATRKPTRSPTLSPKQVVIFDRFPTMSPVGNVATKKPTRFPTKSPLVTVSTNKPTKPPVSIVIDLFPPIATKLPTPSPRSSPVGYAPVAPPAVAPQGPALPRTPSAPIAGGSPVAKSPVVQDPPTSASAPVAPGSGNSPVAGTPVAILPPDAAPVAPPAPALAPTMAHRPTLSPFTPPKPFCTMTIAEYINNVSFTRQKMSLNGTTPEDKALRALVPLDANNTIMPTPCTAVNRLRLRQRYALLCLFYQPLPPGEAWYNATNWSAQNDECTWFGIVCSPVKILEDDNAEVVQLAVTELSLPDNNLWGTIPPDLGLLTSLESFNIRYNFKIKGSLPSTVARWSNLKVYDAMNAHIRGPWPSAMGAWSKLEHISVSAYDDTDGPFIGTMPLFVANWTNIKHVEFESVGFVGTLPALLGQWTNLEYIHLSQSCDFTGTIPSSIASWTNVKTVKIDYQWLTGTVPNVLSQWTQLQELSLAVNRLHGTLPGWLGARNATLRDLDLSSNRFSGTLPSYYLHALTKLTSLQLQRNPFQLRPLSSLAHTEDVSTVSAPLETLDLSNCGIVGTIPEWMGRWKTSLRHLHLANGALTGTIPDALGQLTMLRSLDLHGNRLTGTIPLSFANLTAMQNADVTYNDLIGTVSSKLCSALGAGTMKIDSEVDCGCCEFCFGCDTGVWN